MIDLTVAILLFLMLMTGAACWMKAICTWAFGKEK